MFRAMHHKFSILGNVDLMHCSFTVLNVNLVYTSWSLALINYHTYEQLFPPPCLKKHRCL